jgi:hypothetical protein
VSRIRKKTVELQPAQRPSRIRREPPPAAERADAPERLLFSTSEGEIWLAVFGMIAFALAIDIIVVAISAYTN